MKKQIEVIISFILKRDIPIEKYPSESINEFIFNVPSKQNIIKMIRENSEVNYTRLKEDFNKYCKINKISLVSEFCESELFHDSNLIKEEKIDIIIEDNFDKTGNNSKKDSIISSHSKNNSIISSYSKNDSIISSHSKNDLNENLKVVNNGLKNKQVSHKRK